MTKNVYDSDSDGVVDLLPRAAFNSTDDAPDGADFTLSTEITAPAPGILLISGGIEVFSGSNSDSYDCLLEVDGDKLRFTDLRLSEDHQALTVSRDDAVEAFSYQLMDGLGLVKRIRVSSEVDQMFTRSPANLELSSVSTGSLGCLQDVKCRHRL